MLFPAAIAMMIDSDQSKIMNVVDAWNLGFGAVRGQMARLAKC